MRFLVLFTLVSPGSMRMPRYTNVRVRTARPFTNRSRAKPRLKPSNWISSRSGSGGCGQSQARGLGKRIRRQKAAKLETERREAILRNQTESAAALKQSAIAHQQQVEAQQRQAAALERQAQQGANPVMIVAPPVVLPAPTVPQAPVALVTPSGPAAKDQTLR